jgi:cytochrome c oxidase accessory protein FixG
VKLNDIQVVAEPAEQSLYEVRRKIYPRAVHGWFAAWRWIAVWATQLVFYGGAWLTWNDRQAILFDIVNRKFYIFGLVFWPQDVIYLTVLLIISALSLFLFTAVAGRLWCGYACPQTVYTEIFMWIERRIEGDRNARMRLDREKSSLKKLSLKTLKHGVWIALALWTGFTFVGYVTPIRELGAAVLSLSTGPWETFWILFYGFATYGNAGWMREQVCKYMCPYARFQSAMFDKDTLIITYDAKRGEPRGKKAAKGAGDCVDCEICVQVCPTGIDIRNGLQYECIGCAACIDVCDSVMDKVGYPRGLIRYSTENGIQRGLSRRQMWARVLRTRVWVYGTVLAAVGVGFVASLALRDPFKVDVVRDRGSLARFVDEGKVENVYRLQIMNATERTQRYTIAAEGLPGIAVAAHEPADIGPAQARWVPVRVQLPPESALLLAGTSSAITFRISAQAEGGHPARTVLEKSTFIVPR